MQNEEHLSGVKSLIIGPYSPDFRLSDHFKSYNRGAVNFIHDWPELSRPWPDVSGLVLGSGSMPKYYDDRQPLAWYDTHFLRVNTFLGDTVPDSEEIEANSVLIAHNKGTISVLEPFLSLNSTYQREALKVARVKSAAHLAMLMEDREVMLDKRIRDHEIFDPFRTHPSPLVNMCFAEDHEFPGERTKEFMTAVGGPVAWLDMVATATKDLRDRGVDISEDVTLGVALCLRPLAPGVLPLPEQGIYIYVREYGCRFRPVTDEDRALAKQGHEFDVDHFEIPSSYLNEPGKPTIEALRHIRNADYHSHHSPVAIGLREFFRLVGAPRLETPKTYGLVDKPGRKLLFSSQISAFHDTAAKEKVPGYKPSPFFKTISSLARIEETAYHSEGIVIEADPRDWKDPRDRLMRKIEQRLLLGFYAVMKPLGGFIGAGRPVMVDENLYTKNFSYLSDFHNQGSISYLTSDVLSRYRDEVHLQQQLREGRWDPETYRRNPKKAPSISLMREKELCKLLGVKSREELGFCWAGLASASSRIESGLRDTYEYSRMAARAGMTCFTGGGTRSGMRELIKAHVDAYRDGDRNFRKIGIRVPVVSRHEGDLDDFLRSENLSLNKDVIYESHFSTLGGHLDFIETQFMAQRQHLIYLLARAAVYFIHGSGGDYEAMSNAYHNLRIEKRGKGIFLGTDLNKEVKPMFVINSKVNNGKPHGYFDHYLSFFTPEEREMISQRVFDTPEEGFKAMAAYARSLGYDVPDSDKTRVFMPGSLDQLKLNL